MGTQNHLRRLSGCLPLLVFQAAQDRRHCSTLRPSRRCQVRRSGCSCWRSHGTIQRSARCERRILQRAANGAAGWTPSAIDASDGTTAAGIPSITGWLPGVKGGSAERNAERGQVGATASSASCGRRTACGHTIGHPVRKHLGVPLM